MHKISGLRACEVQDVAISSRCYRAKRKGASRFIRGIRALKNDQYKPDPRNFRRKIRSCYPRGNTWLRMAEFGWD